MKVAVIILSIVVVILVIWLIYKYGPSNKSGIGSRYSYNPNPKPVQTYACIQAISGNQCTGSLSTNPDGSCTDYGIHGGCKTISFSNKQ